jgi:hypothetical protein
MSDTDPTHVELIEMFGGKAGPIETDPDELEVSLALQMVRGQLVDAAEEDKVGVTNLARRLHISPSAVSRTLGGESDMRVSTMVLYARALRRRWDFQLLEDPANLAHGNHPRTIVTIGLSDAGTARSNSAAPAMVTVDTKNWATVTVTSPPMSRVFS